MPQEHDSNIQQQHACLCPSSQYSTLTWREREREREIERDRFGNPQHLGALVPVVPFRFSGSWGCSSRNFGGLRPDSGGPDGATSRYQQILWGFESASAQKWGKSLTEKKSNKMLRYVDGNRWKLWKMKQHYPKVETT